MCPCEQPFDYIWRGLKYVLLSMWKLLQSLVNYRLRCLRYLLTFSALESVILVINPWHRGSWSVFCSFILSTMLQRVVLTSSRQWRYEQDKHIDGLQSDSWILLKHLRAQVMAGSMLWPFWTLLKPNIPIVGCPDTCMSNPYCNSFEGAEISCENQSNRPCNNYIPQPVAPAMSLSQ